MTDSDQAPLFDAPLALLQELADSLGPDPSMSDEELEEQLAALQGAVGEILDDAASMLSEMLEQDGGQRQLSGFGRQAQSEFRDISDQLQDQLAILSDALLNSRSFEELGETKDEVDAIRLAMPMTFSRLESLLESLNEPVSETASAASSETINVQLSAPTPTLPAASGPLAANARIDESIELFDLLSGAIMFVDGHLVSGQSEHLRKALERVEEAGRVLRSALSSGEKG